MKNSSKSKKNVERDRAQVYKSLVKALTNHGFTVRREKLRQGYGWKAQSGACTALSQDLLFVDSRMPLDDQIAFLITNLLRANISLSQEELAELPATYSEQLVGLAA